MAAVKIGSNAPILASKAALDAIVGARVDALIKAMREAHNIKLLVDQVSDADLKALGYNDGTAGTANDIGYLRSGLLACEDLDKIRLGQTPTATLPHVFEDDLKYICQSQ